MSLGCIHIIRNDKKNCAHDYKRKKNERIVARIKSDFIMVVLLIVYLIFFHRSIFVHLIQQNAKNKITIR
jgi:hypothetical protein